MLISGRLDRKIEFPLPDRRQKRLVFSTITSKMNLSDEVDLEDYVARPDKITGADINAICQEAGMQAVRENRYFVLPKDFGKGYKDNITKDEQVLKSDCPHIVVGTPGRILALVRSKKLDLKNLKHFILDECDKMLEQLGKTKMFIIL